MNNSFSTLHCNRNTTSACHRRKRDTVTLPYPEAHQQQKRQTIPKSTTSPPSIESESTEEEEKERIKTLERNRIAASKCRKRKKEWMDELAHKAEMTARENKYLRTLLFQYEEETMCLKKQLSLYAKQLSS